MPAAAFIAPALALLYLAPGLSHAARLEKAAPPARLAAPVRALLDREALVVRAGEQTVMRVWFRAVLPVRAAGEPVPKAVAGRAIPEGTLVGAIELPRNFTDYRGQRIPAGIYTLRFALQPETGDHTGTAPHPEFFLLSPAAADPSAGPIEKNALIELSSRVNEGRHPALLLLWPNDDPDPTPRVLDQGSGVLAAAVRRPATAPGGKTTVGFALTVAGSRQE